VDPFVTLNAPGKIAADLVLYHSLGLEASEAVYAALDFLYDRDVSRAKTLLDQQADRLNAAFKLTNNPQLADDRVTLRKLASLTGNLGKQVRSYDATGTATTGATYTFFMNEFGRVRNGFLSASFVSTKPSQ
jgi:hypothetical protein